MKHFKEITGLQELKKQFRELALKNHPDAGGSTETMKEINCEYDVLFAIWKNRYNAEFETETTETADSTRREFYTEMGWKGKNHDWNRTLKEVAQIVRGYVKEKYPTYKFSIRTSYASMCQELHVEMKESPIEIYKSFEELTSEDKRTVARRLYPFDYMIDDMLHFMNASDEEKKEIIENSNRDSRNKNILNDITTAVLKDVNNFVNSYNYEDCDGMIDYFHVDFYYFDCKYEYVKIVPKTARIKKEKQASATKEVGKVEVKEEVAIVEVVEEIDSGTSVKISFNEEKNGIEIKFDGKPGQEILENLKANGFRWSKYQKIWYAKDTEERRAFIKQFDAQETESEPKIFEYPEIDIEDLENYEVSAELSRRENESNWIFRTKERDHNEELRSILESYQNEVLAIIELTDDNAIIYNIKRDLQRFKKAYYTNYIATLTNKANNPSWLTTGRAGRNARKDHKSMDRYDKLMRESIELVDKFENKLNMHKRKIRKNESFHEAI